MPVSCKARERKSSFKKGVTSEDCRRKREDKTLSVRKSKREDKLRKRRNVKVATPKNSDQSIVVSANNAAKKGPLPTINDLPQLTAAIVSQDRNTRFEAVRAVRKLLSKEEAPPAMEVINAGMVPILVRYLGCVDDVKLQFEAAWALTNISSTDHTAVVVEHGAVIPLVQLLRSPDPDVREQCVWCLGNVSGDGAKLRDIVLTAPGAVEALLLNIQHPHNVSMLRNATWTLSNFCRGKPPAKIECVKPLLPALAKLIHCSDQEVVSDACWALSYVSDGANERIEAVTQAGVVPHLIELLGSTRAQVITPSLRTIGNIASGNDSQTQSIVDSGIIAKSVTLLENSKRSIRKETCWTLSNIAAGNSKQIEALTQNAGTVKKVIELAEHDEWDVRKEAAWVISNVCTGGSPDHVKKTVELGALKSLVSLLDVADPTIVTVALDAIGSVMKKGDMDSDYAVLLDELGGLDKIENLQEHENDEIYKKAMKIIDEHFSNDDDEEDENVKPNANAHAGTFNFGLSDNQNMFQGNAMNFAF